MDMTLVHQVKEAGKPKEGSFRFVARCGYEEIPAFGVRLPPRFTGWGSKVTCPDCLTPTG